MKTLSSLSRRHLISGAGCAGIVAAIPHIGRSAGFPSRHIRLVIHYAAGGCGDQIGRPWADKIAVRLEPAFVENVGGAAGAIGTAAVAREEPDGYSLLLGNGSTQVIVPLASANPVYSTS